MKLLNNKNMQFRIQKRKWSSNIIEIGIEGDNDKIIWTPYLAPLVRKAEGDILCLKLMVLL